MQVRALADRDHHQWASLYRDYAATSRAPILLSDDRFSTLWSWLMDPGHEVQGLTVEAAHGDLVGLAHFRPFARPLVAGVGCFLDDLFVASAARGTGAVDLLLAHLQQVAATNGWDVVRWTTAEDNARARAAYDRVATRTDRVTYEMPPAPLLPSSGHDR